MSVDSTKILYYTGYNSYKNLQVHEGILSIDSTPIANGATRTWSATVTVSPESKFSSCLIQNNRDNNPTVTALKWAPFPSANTVWQTLSVDPSGLNTFGAKVYLSINNSQVTFNATAFNDTAAPIAFNSLDIGFVYAVHTLDI